MALHTTIISMSASCLTAPVDGGRVPNPQAPFTVEGFFPKARTQVAIDAWFNPEPQWDRLNTNLRTLDFGYPFAGSTYYPFSGAISLMDPGYWFAGLTGSYARIRASAEDITLTTLAANWENCFLRNNASVATFLQRCRGPHNPVALIRTADFTCNPYGAVGWSLNECCDSDPLATSVSAGRCQPRTQTGVRSPGNQTASETSLAFVRGGGVVHDRIVVAFNGIGLPGGGDVPFTDRLGWAVTEDSGATWRAYSRGNTVMPPLSDARLTLRNYRGDPSLATVDRVGRPSTVLFADLGNSTNRPPDDNADMVVLLTSTDGGETFSRVFSVAEGFTSAAVDQPWIVTNPASSSFWVMWRGLSIGSETEFPIHLRKGTVAEDGSVVWGDGIGTTGFVPLTVYPGFDLPLGIVGTQHPRMLVFNEPGAANETLAIVSHSGENGTNMLCASPLGDDRVRVRQKTVIYERRPGAPRTRFSNSAICTGPDSCEYNHDYCVGGFLEAGRRVFSSEQVGFAVDLSRQIYYVARAVEGRSIEILSRPVAQVGGFWTRIATLAHFTNWVFHPQIAVAENGQLGVSFYSIQYGTTLVQRIMSVSIDGPPQRDRFWTPWLVSNGTPVNAVGRSLGEYDHLIAIRPSITPSPNEPNPPVGTPGRRDLGWSQLFYGSWSQGTETVFLSGGGLR